MKRMLFGVALILHGLAHSALGVVAGALEPLWLVNTLWAAATVGYIAAGFGVLGVPGFGRCWMRILLASTAASLVLLGVCGTSAFVLGAVIDSAILVVAIAGALTTIAPEAPTAGPRRHALSHAAGVSLAFAIVAYATVVSLARPVSIRWGTTAVDSATPLPGDSLTPNAQFRIDHAITIHAPADSVWRWLVQIGQDRGGFYSYDWMERLVGDRIRNANRVHLEWQARAVGDLVRAVQPDYLGGLFGDSVGWHVSQLVPGRAMVLENWGAFVLVPLDAETTRLIVRTRGEGTPSFLSVLLGPIEVFLFEPVHFVMERGMLRGIRARAEPRAAKPVAAHRAED